MSSSSKGVFYPAIDRLINALEEREGVIKNYERIKDENRIFMRKLKGVSNEEDSDDEY